MNKFIKILTLTLITLTLSGGFAGTAFAVAPLTATFDPNPLFDNSNFVPGDEADASVILNNNTETVQTAYIEAVNVSNGENLASQMNFQIFEGATEIYSDNFETFLNAGPVLLSPINPLGSKTFILKVTFIENSGNNYQNKTLGFDVCVGFSGGDQHCTTDTAVSDEGGTSSSSGSGGGGGSSGGSHRLIIFNEKATNISASGSVIGSGVATITWETNIPATSQVIYGLASGAPYSLDLNILPGFGYPLYSSEDLAKVINHSMVLTGLSPGETYVYRVVSSASPATVSYEHQFTIPIPAEARNIITSWPTGANGVQGEILGVNTGKDVDSGIKGEVAGVFDKTNLATVFTSGWGSLLSKCSLLALLVLLVGYLIWRFAFRPRYEKAGLGRVEIKKRSYIFFGLFSALAIVVALLIGQYCPIPIFIIVLLVSIGMFAYNRILGQ